MVTDIFICDCHSPEHQFTVSMDTKDLTEPYIYVSIRKNSFGNVFQRTWRALKYIFKCGEANYDEVILDKIDTKRLIQVLQQKVF